MPSARAPRRRRGEITARALSPCAPWAHVRTPSESHRCEVCVCYQLGNAFCQRLLRPDAIVGPYDGCLRCRSHQPDLTRIDLEQFSGDGTRRSGAQVYPKGWNTRWGCRSDFLLCLVAPFDDLTRECISAVTEAVHVCLHRPGGCRTGHDGVHVDVELLEFRRGIERLDCNRGLRRAIGGISGKYQVDRGVTGGDDRSPTAIDEMLR